MVGYQQYLHAGVPRLCPSVAAVMEPNVSLQHPSHALRLVPSRARGRRRSRLCGIHQCTAERSVGSPYANRVPASPFPCSETSAIQSAGASQAQATRHASMYGQAVIRCGNPKGIPPIIWLGGRPYMPPWGGCDPFRVHHTGHVALTAAGRGGGLGQVGHPILT